MKELSILRRRKVYLVATLAIVALLAATAQATAMLAGGDLGSMFAAVSLPAPSSISVALDRSAIMDSESTTATAVALPEGSDQNVVWSSSDESIASVDPSGIVTAHAPGSVDIRAEAVQWFGLSKATAAGTLTVNPTPVTELTAWWVGTEGATDNELTIRGYQHLEASAAIEFVYAPGIASNGDVVWSSSDESVASVDAAGVVTALAGGEVTITGVAADGFGAQTEVTLTVIELVDQVAIAPIAHMSVDATLQAVAVVGRESATNKSIYWTSDNTDRATIDENGVITALSNGQVTIWADPADGQWLNPELPFHPWMNWSPLEAAMVFDVYTPVSSVETTISFPEGVDPEALTVLDSGITVSAEVLPSTASTMTVEWSSSNESVATVDADGNVVLVGVGTANIMATATDGTGICDMETVTVNAILVSSVHVVLGSDNIPVGGEALAWAEILPLEATDDNYTWSSSNESVATVDASGIVTGIGAGTARITATANDGSELFDYADISVYTVLMESLDVSLASSTIVEGDSIASVVAILPMNTTNKQLAWTSSNEDAATVDANGVITAVAPGSAFIYATAQDGSLVSDMLGVTVIDRFLVESIEVTLADAEITVGAASTFASAAVAPENVTDGSYLWSSSNPAVASVDALTGEVTAVSGGSADIVATANDASGVSGSAAVTVIEKVTGLDISAPAVMDRGAVIAASVAVAPTSATVQTVLWSSDATSVVSVDEASGELTAISKGFATISAVAADGSEVSDSVVIEVIAAVKSIAVDLSKTEGVTLRDGSSIMASAVVTPSDATTATVVWSSSDEDVATVDAEGTLTIVGVGSANIVASSTDGSGVSGSAALTVNPVLVESIGVSLSASTVSIGATATASAAVLPLDATDGSYTWSSSNSAVATVDSNGVVTSVAAGSANIVATANDGSGISGSAEVNVPAILVSSVVVSTADNTLVAGTTSQASAVVLPANASNPMVVWSSTNASVLTVDANGLVTAVAEGTASVMATAADGSGFSDSEDITVSAAPVVVAKPVLSTPLLSASSPLVGRNFYIRGTIRPQVAAGSPTVAAKIQKRRADGTYGTVKTVKMSSFNFTGGQSTLRALTSLTSRGTYRVRFATTSGPAAVSQWLVFRIR